MAAKNSSLNVLRKAQKDSFFLDDSDNDQDPQEETLDNDDDFDVDNMDFPLPTEETQAAHPAGISSNQPLTPAQLDQIRALMGSGAVGGEGGVGGGENGVRYVSGDEVQQFKSWMCIYPCYIDGTKTVAEGRRIGLSDSCKKQPFAKEIVEALKELRLSQAFEPGKTHPRDWANRGRVRVQFKDDQGRYCHPTIHSKQGLLLKLASLINQQHARDEKDGKERPEYSPLSPLTPLAIVMPGMANQMNPLAALMGGGGDDDDDEDEKKDSSSTAVATTSGAPPPAANQPKEDSKRQKKLAKKPKRVMIRG